MRAAETIVHLRAAKTDVHFFVGNVLIGHMPNQDEGEVHCEVTILESAVPNQDEGEVHCEVTILESVVPDDDEGEVRCEVTILKVLCLTRMKARSPVK